MFVYFISMNVFSEEGSIADLKPYTSHCEIELEKPITTIGCVHGAQEKIKEKHGIMCVILNFKLLRNS